VYSFLILIVRYPLHHGRLLAACLLLSSPLQAGITVTDDAGYTLTLPQPARRIVSLAPHITELLYAAGAGAAVVGVSEYSDYPDAAKRIARIGGGGGLDIETIFALHPDLVIAWQSGNPAGAVQRLRDLGLPVFLSEPHRLAEIPTTMQRLAQLAGTEATAGSAVNAFNHRLAALRRHYSGKSPVSVFYQIWDRPLMTVSGAHLVNDVIELCGGRNVFAGLPDLAPQVAQEAVLARNPQVIIVAAADNDSTQELASWQRWPQLLAVRSGHVHALQRELLVRHSPRILDGAERLCKLLERARTGR